MLGMEDRLLQEGMQAGNSRVRGEPNAGPLRGLNVLELGSVLMVPYATQLLGDLGADVIRVEWDSLDPSRLMGGEVRPALSNVALNLHRNKRSIHLDLRSSSGRAAFLRLLDQADIFVTNLRPSALERLRIDFPTVTTSRPELIYCESHGFRSTSDHGDRPAYDDVLQAESGLAALSASVGDHPSFIPSVIADKICALIIVNSVLSSVIDRQHSGRGQHIEVPMFDSMLAFNLVEHLAGATTPGGQPGYSRILTRFRGPHRTKDGYLAVMPYSDQHWYALYSAVGREAELKSPWFASSAARLANPDIVYSSLARLMLERPTEEWYELCTELGVPVGRVETLSDIVVDENKHRGVLESHNHPLVGEYAHIRHPALFGRNRTELRRHAPLPGEDTVEILEEAGFTSSEIKELLHKGVVKTAGDSIEARHDTST